MRPFTFILCILAASLTPSVHGQVTMTKQEALTRFLGPSAVRSTLYLTDQQSAAVESKAKAKVSSKVVTYYAGNGRFAYFESRTIRTMPATFVVVLDSAGTVHTVEMLAFYEPEDYQPPVRWMRTFSGKTINDDLWLKRGIHAISGATMSAHAVTESVRRILALHSIAVLPGRKDQR